MGGLFSKPKAQKSESGNKAYDYLQGAYSPMVSGGTGAYGNLGSALGIGGDFAGQQKAYDNYLNNSGFKYAMDQGMQGVTNSGAGHYLLRSGATAKALQDRATNISQGFYNNYLDRLAQMSQLGLGAGGLIANAGQYSKGTGPTQGGMGWGLLSSALQAAPMAFSDRRLKTNIVKTGEYPDGLGQYEWNWKSDPNGPVQRGVIADEVKELRPWAYVPNYQNSGYDGVDYGRL